MSTQQVQLNGGAGAPEMTTHDTTMQLAAVAFEVANASVKPSQSIGHCAAAAAGTQEDAFNGYERVDTIQGATPSTTLRAISINGKHYGLNDNTFYDGTGWVPGANVLMYTNQSTNQHILQVDGKLVHITDPSQLNHDTYFTAFEYFDSQTDPDSFKAFAESVGITKHTVLGAKLILKQHMVGKGSSMEKLDETFMNPQSDYLSFINQTISPGIEANLTAALSAVKSAIDILKKIIQKAS